ncbi:MAG TPA: hypothetical protein VN703_03885 [Candidatus Sulfopaludibacter sp.]|nr:hypothetical protein [Candidatus Sulfopaludibacter sp.]
MLNNKCEDNEIEIKQIFDKAVSNEFNVLLNESERIFCSIYILKKVKDGNLEITEDMKYAIRDYFVSKYQIKMLYDRMKELKPY